jgi:hypothetical protein
MVSTESSRRSPLAVYRDYRLNRLLKRATTPEAIAVVTNEVSGASSKELYKLYELAKLQTEPTYAAALLRHVPTTPLTTRNDKAKIMQKLAENRRDRLVAGANAVGSGVIAYLGDKSASYWNKQANKFSKITS